MFRFNKFGEKLTEYRETKGLSQREHENLLYISCSLIGIYIRDEMKPSIDVVKMLADTLETTAGYLLGETQDRNF